MMKNKKTEEKTFTKEIPKQPKGEERQRRTSRREKRSPIVMVLLVLTLISSFLYFIGTVLFEQSATLTPNFLIPRFLFILFTILFVLFGLSTPQKKNGILALSALFLLGYYLVSLLSISNLLPVTVTKKMEDLRGMSLTDVVTWAEKNAIEIQQDYEYSDMVEEYHVISQDIEEGKDLKNVHQVTIAVSEGASPYKEVILPNMIGWDSDQVIDYVNENYLLNVHVEFVASEEKENTVIDQSKMGSILREEELKLTFSYGEQRDGDTVRMNNLLEKSEFEAVFYLKQQGLNYKILEDYSSEIKKGYVMKQNIKTGTSISRNDTVVELTISKGPKIKVPQLLNMSLKEITNWIIENKLKLELSRAYDAKIEKNNVIKANYQENDIIAQGTVVKIVLSKGKIIMPKFTNLEEFRKWVTEYGIQYQEVHEFNENVKVGEVIEYSLKQGETLQNGDSITVKVSDGKAVKVPRVTGMSKQEAISALKKAGLNANTYYQASSKKKDTVLSQSISAGSSVGEGTTITLALSSGKESTSSSSSSSSNTSSSGSSSSSGNSSGNHSSAGTTTPSTPSCDASVKEPVILYNSLIALGEPETTCANVKNAYPTFKIQCTYVNEPGFRAGMIFNSAAIMATQFDHCSPVVLQIIKY